jgi:glutamate-ammonia-ligase adenylyltransferase
VQPRDPAALREEVLAMREKINAGHPNTSKQFDLKHDRGGMVDVEFVTQYLVLCYAGTHAVLVRNLGNITLLRLASEAGLIAPDLAARAADAYRVLRRVQHQLRMQGVEKARVGPDELVAERQAVSELWDTVMGRAPG